MKLDMNEDAARTAQVGINALVMGLIAYFVIVVLWDGSNDNKRDIELAKEANIAAKIEACSIAYGWSEYHKEQYVSYDFCGDEDE